MRAGKAGTVRSPAAAGRKEAEERMSELYWVALSYHLPSDSSKSRVYVWRKLREAGAENLRPGIAILPRTPENTRKFRGLLQKIREFGGSGTLTELKFLEEAAEQEMVEQFAAQARSGYDRAIHRGLELLKKAPDTRELGRLEKELEKVRRQDYFHAGLTGELRTGLEELIHAAGESLHEFAGDLRDLLDEKN